MPVLPHRHQLIDQNIRQTQRSHTPDKPGRQSTDSGNTRFLITFHRSYCLRKNRRFPTAIHQMDPDPTRYRHHPARYPCHTYRRQHGRPNHPPSRKSCPQHLNHFRKHHLRYRNRKYHQPTPTQSRRPILPRNVRLKFCPHHNHVIPQKKRR